MTSGFWGRAGWCVLLLATQLLLSIPTLGASCVAEFVNQHFVDTQNPKIAINDPVLLGIKGAKNSEKIKARFLGLDFEHERYYFADESNGKVVYISEKHLTLTDKAGKKTIHPTVVDLSVVRQTAEDCAVHSSANCILFLQKQRMIPRDHPVARLSWNRLYQIFYNVDAKYGRDASYFYQQGYGMWRSILAAAAEESQTEKRSDILLSLRVRSKVTDRISNLVKHLENGNPAIIDAYSVLIEKNPLEKSSYPTGIELQSNRYRTVPTSAAKTDGGHSVLAIGVVKTGWFSKRIVILDSGTGDVRLWKPSDLKKGIVKATLVYPSSLAPR